MKLNLAVILTIITASGCMSNSNPEEEPTLGYYTEPEESGLVGIRPYPNPNDVCQVVGENNTTAEFLDDSLLLIACPKHEKGALEDRLREGARVVGYSKHWTLLHISES